MKSKILIFAIIFLAELCTARTVDFYGKKINVKNICDQVGHSNEIAQNYFDKICKAAGINNNFIMVPCAAINNCQATLQNGNPCILYDNDFLNKIKTVSYGFTEKKITNAPTNKTNNDWATLTILAHELGHHENQHFSEANIKRIPVKEMELQADEYAGNILFRLGASLQEGEKVYNTDLIPILAGDTHPGRADRLKSFEKGYNDAAKFIPTPNNTNTIGNAASLILGSWTDDKGSVVLTFFNNASFKISQNGKTNEGQWSLADEILSIKNNGAPADVKLSIVGINTYALSLKGEDNSILTLKRTNLTATSSATDYLIKNWTKYIYIDKFNFTSRKIGGIWDVNVPLVNNSDYVMDLIRVKVDYIKDSNLASGDIYKSELIDFTNVQPHTRQVIKAPDSDRGTGIRTTIVILHSSVMHIN